MRKARKKTKRTTPAATEMSTAEAAVATLIAHGLDTVYALPGIHNDHLFDAFQRNSENLRVVHTRHEQGAAYMALGAAMAKGRPAVFTVVPGPGLLNAAAALAFDRAARLFRRAITLNPANGRALRARLAEVMASGGRD